MAEDGLDQPATVADVRQDVPSDPIEAAEEFEPADEHLEGAEPGTRIPRPAGTQWLMTRRRIEQAREQRELARSLEDFEDYLS